MNISKNTTLSETILVLVLICLPIIYSCSNDNDKQMSSQSETEVQITQSEVPEITESVIEDVTLLPYQLLRNPYMYKNKRVRLNVREVPAVSGNRVLTLVPGRGLEVDRMLSENEILFNIIVYDSAYVPAGQILIELHNYNESVNINNINEPLNLKQTWIVEPLGVIEGTNAFGGPVTIPKIKFWGYQ